jgi:benzoylformate decarboxylase/acetolactate synthase-1/2/3 large subunit
MAGQPSGDVRYGSDLVVDLLQEQGIEYVAMNPGASFRGLHDSLVNYAGGKPELLEIPHEKVAVGIAHGYAKATGRPMGVITHDLVGLLHATLGVYYAYIDRVPMLVLGGAGPMDGARRRPWIDWIHTANVQNSAVRDYTKWDDHPYSVAAIPESLARAFRVATSEPQGPVYVALDADLQEQLVEDYRRPAVGADAAPTRLAPDPDALADLARTLAAAHRPALVTGSVGRDPAMWPVLVELAELLGAAVVDTNIRLNFPTRHPLNATGTDVLGSADVVLTLDVKDIGQHTQLLTKQDRGGQPRLAAGARLLDIGFGDLGISSWSADYGSWFKADQRVVADTSLALPALLELCRGLVAEESDAVAGRRAGRRDEIGALHRSVRERWRERATTPTGAGPMSTAHLVSAVGDAISGYDWVLTAGTGNGWATKLWDFDAPYRHPGRSLGTATQIGISLGVALAHRGSGRLVVDLQPDGDLMFDASALWVATRHRIPMLVVMVNNRAYNNDWVHQRHVAQTRGTPMDNTGVGIVIDDPAPDFATLARSFGWDATGLVTDPAEVTPAVARAAEIVATTGQPALVDVVCSPDD